MREFGVAMENVPPQLQNDNFGQSPPRDGSRPAKSGAVWMLQSSAGGGKQRRVKVILNVHHSNFGSYAVVSQDKAFSKGCGYMNLRSCTVKEGSVTGSHCFQVIPRDCDANTLTFCVNNGKDLSEWLEVLASKDNTRQFGKPKLSKLNLNSGRLRRSLLSPVSPKPETPLPALLEEE